jgi:hypothetical protein
MAMGVEIVIFLGCPEIRGIGFLRNLGKFNVKYNMSVMPCKLTVGYYRFGWAVCLHLLGCFQCRKWRHYTVRSKSRCALRLRYGTGSGLCRRSWTSLPTPFVSAQRLSKHRSAENVCECNETGSGLYRRSWTSLPTPVICAQRLSERTVLHQNYSISR